MASDDPQTLVETAGEIMQSEIDRANETTAAVVAAAGEAIDHAQMQAQEIARAAMETEIGRRVGALEQGEARWQEQLEGLRRDLMALSQQVSDLASAVSATATLTVATALQAPDPSLSIPDQSLSPPTIAEAVEEVTEVVPGQLSESIPAAPVVVAAPPRKHRFL